MHATEELKIRRECLYDKTDEHKYHLLNCGLIQNSVKDLSRIEINNDNWTRRADSGKNGKQEGQWSYKHSPDIWA